MSALNRLVRKLDKRLQTREGNGKFKFKERVLADPSHLEPPVGCIPWAEQETQDKGETDDGPDVSFNSSSVFESSAIIM